MLSTHHPITTDWVGPGPKWALEPKDHKFLKLNDNDIYN
jgi:hypothetical protein